MPFCLLCALHLAIASTCTHPFLEHPLDSGPPPLQHTQAKKMYQGLKKREAEKAARVAALEHKAASLKNKGVR